MFLIPSHSGNGPFTCKVFIDTNTQDVGSTAGDCCAFYTRAVPSPKLLQAIDLPTCLCSITSLIIKSHHLTKQKAMLHMLPKTNLEA